MKWPCINIFWIRNVWRGPRQPWYASSIFCPMSICCCNSCCWIFWSRYFATFRILCKIQQQTTTASPVPLFLNRIPIKCIFPINTNFSFNERKLPCFKIGNSRFSWPLTRSATLRALIWQCWYESSLGVFVAANGLHMYRSGGYAESTTIIKSVVS